MRRFLIASAFVIVCTSTALALADDNPAPDEKFGDTPALAKMDFPPGAFTDGGHYRLSDFQGKVLVLYFYEPECPTARGLVPKRSALVEEYKDKPVRFIAVASHDSLSDARSYVGTTKLAMPAFADNLSIMESRFHIDISMSDIYQTRIIDGNGHIASSWDAPREEDIDAALKTAKWKYKNDGYDPRLSGIVDLLEWNQFETGMRLLRPYTRNIGKTGDSAKKLFAAVKVEGQQWSDEAKTCQASDPGHAMDLYNRLAICFPTDDLGTAATASLKAMKTDKAVKDELAARQMFARLYAIMPQVTPAAKQQVIAYCNSIAEKYPDTATAKRAQLLATDLQSAPAPHDQ